MRKHTYPFDQYLHLDEQTGKALDPLTRVEGRIHAKQLLGFLQKRVHPGLISFQLQAVHACIALTFPQKLTMPEWH